jgi:hypothetical protein
LGDLGSFFIGSKPALQSHRLPDALFPAEQAPLEADAGGREVSIDRRNRRGGKIDRSFVSRLLGLTLLAPDIQEAILEGRPAKGVQLDEPTKSMPCDSARWRRSPPGYPANRSRGSFTAARPP